MESIRLKARAKINLGLDVLRKREDGYHDVRMVMQTIGIYDRLIITKIPEEDIRIKSNLFFLPVNENNLIYKAAKLLKDRCGFAGGVEIDLNKFIPVSAGLAGGSTDAASTLCPSNNCECVHFQDFQESNNSNCSFLPCPKTSVTVHQYQMKYQQSPDS